jgi:hypothetical protein
MSIENADPIYQTIESWNMKKLAQGSELVVRMQQCQSAINKLSLDQVRELVERPEFKEFVSQAVSYVCGDTYNAYMNMLDYKEFNALQKTDRYQSNYEKLAVLLKECPADGSTIRDIMISLPFSPDQKLGLFEIIAGQDGFLEYISSDIGKMTYSDIQRKYSNNMQLLQKLDTLRSPPIPKPKTVEDIEKLSLDQILKLTKEDLSGMEPEALAMCLIKCGNYGGGLFDHISSEQFTNLLSQKEFYQPFIDQHSNAKALRDLMSLDQFKELIKHKNFAVPALRLIKNLLDNAAKSTEGDKHNIASNCDKLAALLTNTEFDLLETKNNHGTLIPNDISTLNFAPAQKLELFKILGGYESFPRYIASAGGKKAYDNINKQLWNNEQIEEINSLFFPPPPPPPPLTPESVLQQITALLSTCDGPQLLEVKAQIINHTVECAGANSGQSSDLA